MLIPFVHLNYNEYSFSYDIYKKLDYDTYLLEYMGNPYSINEKDYPEFKTNKYYFNEITDHISLPFIGGSVVIDENYDDYDIQITDYTKENLEKLDLIKDNSITYGNYTLNIKSVKSTNYKWYLNLNANDKSFYSSFVYYYYNNVYMNTHTFMSVCEAKYKQKNVEINDINLTVKSFSDDFADDSVNISNTSKYYKNTTKLNKGEIILDRNTLKKFFNVGLDLANDEIIGNKKIEISGQSYKVVDIAQYSVYKIILSDEDYYAFNGEDNYRHNNLYTSFQITNKKDFINLVKDLNSKNRSIFSPFDSDISFAESEVASTRFISKYVVAFAIILFVFSSIYLTKTLVDANKKRLGVARSLGLSKKKMQHMILYKILQIVVVALLISIICYLAYFIRINTNIIKETSLDFFVVKFSYLGLIIYLVIILILIYLLFIFMIKRFNKRDLKENIDE